MVKVVAHSKNGKLECVEFVFPSGLRLRSERLADAEDKVKLKEVIKFLDSHGVDVKFDLNGLRAF